jgi:thiamine pyrophosphokinase
VQQTINPVNPSAIVIANGLACRKKLITDCMLSFPLVVVLDAAVERLSDLDIIPNVLLGDFDAGFDAGFYLEKYPHLEIIETPDQNKTDLEKAFDYLIEKEIKTVYVFWATGKRSDHALANLSCIVKYRNTLSITLIDDHSKIQLLDKHFSNWYLANTCLSLMPLGKVTGISTKNLLYPLHKEELNTGYRMGNSNSVVKDGIVTIEHESGDLLLMECKD